MSNSIFIRFLHKFPLLLIDAVGVCAAVCLAYLIRFDFEIWPYYVDQLSNFLIIFVLIRAASFYYFGLYRGIGRYFSLNDMTGLVKALSLGTALIMGIDYFRNYGIGLAVACLFAFSAVLYWLSTSHETLWRNRKRQLVVFGVIFGLSFFTLVGAAWIFKGSSPSEMSPVAQVWLGGYLLSQDFLYNLGIPRSIIILEWILCLFFIGGAHLIPRLVADAVSGYKQHKASRVLIIGAGDAGEMTVREARKNPNLGYLPVGFIDDNLFKRNAKIHGLEVLGTREDIVRVVKEKDVDEILITIPSIQGPALRQLLSQCRKANVPVKTLPGLTHLLAGRFKIDDLETVDTSFLLGREEVVLDLEAVAKYLKGKNVLVTGAGGSIGSELCRQIVDYDPERLIMLGKGENSIYEIENDIRSRCHPDIIIEPVIADVRDHEKLEQVFAKYRPDVVFHAAAHKHVPLMERHPDEAIKNNVFGTLNLGALALQYEASAFVMISTDKAVNPTSIMGVSKKIAELIVQNFAKQGDTKFVIVRFGNVIRSRGSVIPLFEKQIRSGGPVTVTHPDMTRYFMSIPEAVHLVLQSGSIAESGNICVLDMGEPIKIVDLARNLIRMAGLSPDADIQIEFTGLRPGEKLFEEILTSGEMIKKTKFEKIYLDESDQIDSEVLQADLDKLKEYVEAFDLPNTIKLLFKLVPTYVPQADSLASNYHTRVQSGS